VKEFPHKEKKEDSPQGIDGSDEWEDGTEEMYDHNYRKYLLQMEALGEDDDAGSNLYYEEEEQSDFDSAQQEAEEASRKKMDPRSKK